MTRRVLLSDQTVQSKKDTTDSAEQIEFFSTGAYLLDLMLGGGWAQGRVINLVGDRSSGKTLIAVEAVANILNITDKAYIRYREVESAWNAQYARTIGMPVGIEPPSDEIDTVEQLFSDLDTFLNTLDGKKPALYVVDSLDALSDSTEMESDFDKGSYGAAKAKLLSKLFRQRIRVMERKNCTLLVISQIRDKIGVMFGETKTRSGGRALDFYASQIVWLAEVKKIERTVLGEKRVIGSLVKARCRKNKVGMPHREVEIAVLYNYGVDDEESMIAYCEKQKILRELPETWPDEGSKLRAQLALMRKQQNRSGIRELQNDLRRICYDRWMAIEERLAPTMSKYE